MDKIYVFNSYYNTIEVIDIDSFILEKELRIEIKETIGYSKKYDSVQIILNNLSNNKKVFFNNKEVKVEGNRFMLRL